MEIHHELLATEVEKRKSSKTELFCCQPPHSYTITGIYDDADFLPIMDDDKKFIPVVHKFYYLFPMIKIDLKDQVDVDSCIKNLPKSLEH
eukprot:1492631-Ditylum_brightwellii.AAC.1